MAINALQILLEDLRKLAGELMSMTLLESVVLLLASPLIIFGIIIAAPLVILISVLFWMAFLFDTGLVGFVLFVLTVLFVIYFIYHCVLQFDETDLERLTPLNKRWQYGIKNWEEGWMIFTITILVIIITSSVFVPPLLSKCNLMLVMIYGSTIAVCLLWMYGNAKRVNIKYTKTTRALCETKHLFGENSEEFETCLNKGIEYCKRVWTVSEESEDERAIRRGVRFFKMRQSLSEVAIRLSNLVEVNYESWQKKYADQLDGNETWKDFIAKTEKAKRRQDKINNVLKYFVKDEKF